MSIPTKLRSIPWRLRCAVARRRALLAGLNIHPTATMTPATHFTGDHHLITIGAGTRLSGCLFVTHSGFDRIASRLLDLPIDSRRPIKIGRDCFIGAGAYIGSGADIGDNCVVGMGAVVRGRFAPDSVIIGNPAVRVGSTRAYLERLRSAHEGQRTQDLGRARGPVHAREVDEAGARVRTGGDSTAPEAQLRPAAATRAPDRVPSTVVAFPGSAS